jgi:hypothetical protein
MKRESLTHEELFLKLAGELPKELIFQREPLIARLWDLQVSALSRRPPLFALAKACSFRKVHRTKKCSRKTHNGCGAIAYHFHESRRPRNRSIPARAV